MLQVRNEVASGHLARFLERNLPILDALYAFDDASTDASPELLEAAGAIVLRSPVRFFTSELVAKNSLLTEIQRLEGEGTWILRLDADEVLYASRTELEEICVGLVEGGFDSAILPTANLWKSQTRERLDDNFANFRPVRIWRSSPQVRFPNQHGLHITSDPLGIRKTRVLDAYPVVHYGFASQELVLDKCVSYWNVGQRGYALNRLLIDDFAETRELETSYANLGSRWSDFEHRDVKIDPCSQVQTLLQFNQRVSTKSAAKPKVTLVSLIFQGIDWLEMQYAELLSLAREFPVGDVEIVFIANDATEEVLEYLASNSIPHFDFKGRRSPGEWYINSVYRAYNKGVEIAKGEYVLLVNSDMVYAKGFLKNLLARRAPNRFVCGRLVESGRLVSGTHGVEKDFGSSPKNFQRAQFERFAESLLDSSVLEGGLFMPLLAHRETFLSLGGFPQGNLKSADLSSYLEAGPFEIGERGDDIVPGDAAFFQKAQKHGITHETLSNALAYHFQEGELRARKRLFGVPRRPSSGAWVANDSLAGINGESVFWERLIEELESKGISVRKVETGRPTGPISELTNPFRLALKLWLLRLQVGRPRVLLRNASYTFPASVGIRNISLFQDNLGQSHMKLLQKLTISSSQLVITNDLQFFVQRKGKSSMWAPLPVSDFWLKTPLQDAPGQSGSSTCMFVGSFSDTKGWPTLLEIVKSTPEVHWILVSKYQNDPHGLDATGLSNYEVHRQVSPAKLVELLCRANVLICASPLETQHLASLEALTRGVPVLTLPTGLLGQFGVGEHFFGRVVEKLEPQVVLESLSEDYSPEQLRKFVEELSRTSLDRWTDEISHQLQLSFEKAGSLGYLARFAQRVKSAIKDEGRKRIRRIISRLIEFRNGRYAATTAKNVTK